MLGPKVENVHIRSCNNSVNITKLQQPKSEEPLPRPTLYRPGPDRAVPVETRLIRASLHCRWGTLFAIDISLYCLCRLESAANHQAPDPSLSLTLCLM